MDGVEKGKNIRTSFMDDPLLEVVLFQLNQIYQTVDRAFSNFIPDSKRYIL